MTEYNDPYIELSQEMEKISVSPSLIGAMNELAYTASETEIIPFDFHDDADLKSMIQLVELAKKYEGNIPEKLRM